MKKALLVCLIVIFILFPGCTEHKSNNKEIRTEEVVVHLPEDDTVNGYRLPSKNKTESSKTQGATNTPETSTGFCANKKTKVFHKLTCSSVKTMKEENKSNVSGREQLIGEGYTPCKRCNP